MGWICPKCGNRNKDELDKCNLCHLGKLGEETYQKRAYMYRLEPTTVLVTFLLIVLGILLLAVVSTFCILAIIESDNMGYSFGFGLLGFIFICLGSYSVLEGIVGHKAMNMLKEGRVSTNAEVLGRYTEEYDAGGNYGGVSVSYYIDIQFDASEKKYAINAKVNNDIYEKAERGKMLKVTYADSNPCVLLFEGED